MYIIINRPVTDTATDMYILINELIANADRLYVHVN